MADAAPEVSVIIPSYKTTKYIGASIDSVLNQTFQDFEIVVVSDGCPDSAALEEVLRPYGPRVKYIWQTNRGTGVARNTAIRASAGKYIVQLDADDLLDPGCLASQVRMMREHPEYDAIYCNSFNFADSPKAAEQWPGYDQRYYMDMSPSTGPVSFCSILETRTVPRVLGSIIRREILDRIGMHDEVERFAEDLDLWLRMLKANPPGRIGYNLESLGRYRLREDNYTLDVGGASRLLAVLDKAGRVLDLTPEERECLKRRRAVNQFEVDMVNGKLAIRERRWKDAARCYRACYAFSRKKKYLAAVLVLRACPWALPLGLRLIGRQA
jgi:glycosyltransferase involved in cell wall biosynthesis